MYFIKGLFNKENATLYKLTCSKIIQGFDF